MSALTPPSLLTSSRACNAQDGSVVPESGGEFCHVWAPATPSSPLCFVRVATGCDVSRRLAGIFARQTETIITFAPVYAAVTSPIRRTDIHKVRMVRTHHRCL